MSEEAARKAAQNRDEGKRQAEARRDFLRAPAKRDGFTRRVYRSPADERIWGADLLDMSTKLGSMRGYALVIVDYFTRQQYWELLTAKTTREIEKGFEAAFARAGFKPKRIHSDKESGLVHSPLMRDLGITIYHTGPGSHAYLAENAIKQYRARLPSGTSWKQPIRDGSYEERYNATNKMMSLGKKTPDELAALARQKPEEVHALHKAREEAREDEAPAAPKILKAGSKVLIQRQRELFEKKTGAQNWEADVYEIAEIDDRTRPVMYFIRKPGEEPLRNRFYREQLKIVPAGKASLFAHA